ncbi:MAG: LamG domain-containing protein [Candidatus Micrarchaeia archaeon]
MEKQNKMYSKAQSAMEYLMTYGWAILIISIVLAALFQLGVFNPMAFAAKAQPGSCQVYRPNGPGTTYLINLEGLCNGEIPEYVADFSSGNLAGSYPNPLITNAFTVSAWVNGAGRFWELAQGTCDEAGAYTFFGYYDDEGSSNTGWYSFSNVPPQKNNNWYFVTVTGANGVASLYLNGVYISSITASTTLQYENVLSIGGGYACSSYGGYYSGLISNEQIYNTSLSANEIQALYQEGIGGAPIDLQNLVGWWPLNGNANDYSGNGYNLIPTNGVIDYVSNWYSSYTPP